ncbi:sensor histidine kinase [Thalassotalea ganghwensis]
MQKLNEQYSHVRVYWLIPAILGAFIYLNIYWTSQFSGPEQFSWWAIAQQIVLMYLYWLVGAFFIKKEHSIRIQNVLLSFVVISVLSIAAQIATKLLLIEVMNQNDHIQRLHLYNYAVHGVLVAIAVSLFVMLLRHLEGQRQAQLINLELQKQNAQFQLQALQTQLNPHFLFNNLNTLSSLIPEESAQAHDFINHLSDLLRYMLKETGKQLVPLEQELNFLQQFSVLLTQRFGDSFNLVIEVSQQDDLFLPPFTLQLLLENVIKHNRIDLQHPLRCRISQNDGYLIFDNNKNLKTGVDSTGLGLKNLAQRYALICDHKMIIDDKSDKFTVSVPLLKVAQLD